MKSDLQNFIDNLLPSGNLGKADLHVHTNVFDGFNSPEELIDFVEEKTDLSVISITDHNTIKGAERGFRYSKERGYRTKVIIGCEVNTRTRAHVIGLFLKRPIKIFRRLEDTIADIHDQGGLAVAVHPFNRLAQGVSLPAFVNVMANDDPFFRFDAIEVINASPNCKKSSRRAFKVSSLFDVARLASSDAHDMALVGTAYTFFEGRSVDDLRRSILNKKTIPGGGFIKWSEATPKKYIKGAIKAWGLGLPLMAYYLFQEKVRKKVRE